jgi:hypothetical protein
MFAEHRDFARTGEYEKFVKACDLHAVKERVMAAD